MPKAVIARGVLDGVAESLALAGIHAINTYWCGIYTLLLMWRIWKDLLLVCNVESDLTSCFVLCCVVCYDSICISWTYGGGFISLEYAGAFAALHVPINVRVTWHVTRIITIRSSSSNVTAPQSWHKVYLKISSPKMCKMCFIYLVFVSIHESLLQYLRRRSYSLSVPVSWNQWQPIVCNAWRKNSGAKETSNYVALHISIIEWSTIRYTSVLVYSGLNYTPCWLFSVYIFASYRKTSHTVYGQYMFFHRKEEQGFFYVYHSYFYLIIQSVQLSINRTAVFR